MDLALRRERDRSDRQGYQFCVLELADSTRPAFGDLIDVVAQRLTGRLRITDQIGWLAQQQLGVLLTDTTPTGGWKVAAEVSRLLSELPLELTLHLYAYPSDWTQLRGNTSNRVSAAEGQPEARPAEILFCRPLPRWKRALDLALAGAGLVLLSPGLAVIALLIKLTSPGPVLFCQERIGLSGQPFQMLKFRTMVPDAHFLQEQLRSQNEQDGPAFKMRLDPRVTSVGAALRRTAIDELPQLWNVLRGEMSLVGPRPLPTTETEACAPWQRERLDVTPGLTCLWQVNKHLRVSFSNWMRMDISYVRSRSLLLDVALIARTIGVLLRGRAE